MTKPDWQEVKAYEDITYHKAGGVARIAFNRPEVRNAFRPDTLLEMQEAFKDAGEDTDIGVVLLTGNGPAKDGKWAFCSGGDQKQRQETGDYGPSETGLFEIETFHRVIREVPKPVIAAVNGVAVGGGHVLHALCDITIAADHARFGQAGPRVGSFDAGFGTAYLARILGEKRAREVWYLCRLYDAATMERWGLVNQVVPGSELRAEVRRWADEMLEKSPTALRVLKHSFNADSESVAGLGTMAFDTLEIFVETEEAREGVEAFAEKRLPDFSKHR